jgi:hypothetical protein
VLSVFGEFLIKDIVLLGVALWTLGDSLGAHRRTRPASQGHSATVARSAMYPWSCSAAAGGPAASAWICSSWFSGRLDLRALPGRAG